MKCASCEEHRARKVNKLKCLCHQPVAFLLPSRQLLSHQFSSVSLPSPLIYHFCLVFNSPLPVLCLLFFSPLFFFSFIKMGRYKALCMTLTSPVLVTHAVIPHEEPTSIKGSFTSAHYIFGIQRKLDINCLRLFLISSSCTKFPSNLDGTKLFTMWW